MMNHEILKEKLFLYFDGEIPEGERGEIAAHLKICGECAQTVKRWEMLSGTIARTQLEPSGTFVYKVMERLSAEEKTAAAPVLGKRPVFLKWLLPTLGYTFAIILMFNAIKSREVPVNTEGILLAGIPQKAQWRFEAGTPDVRHLIAS